MYDIYIYLKVIKAKKNTHKATWKPLLYHA